MFSIFIFPFIFLLSAIALLPRQSSPITPFIARAFQPGSLIHLSSLNANDGHFWLGKATSTYCPTTFKPHCPTSIETALMVSSNGSASLDAAVPAGQVIYVAKDGALSFTKAYEGNVTATAYPSGFSYDNSDPAGGLNSFTFSETPSKGWLACPAAKDGPWQVYAFIRDANDTGCMEFEVVGESYRDGGVWQYD